MEVSNEVLSILNGEGMIPSLNSTFSALIAKKCTAKSVVDFSTIILYNVLYKLVSKVLTNRFKPIMHTVISSNQSDFIPGKLISDNLMVAHELLHTMRQQKKGKEGKMAVKLDMSKAYDRVE